MWYTLAMGNLIEDAIEKIRNARERQGASQKAVGKAIGLTAKGYGHYETGARAMKLEQFLALPRALKVSVSVLLPDSLLTDYERMHMDDPRLDEIIHGWHRLSEPAKDHVLDAYRFGIKQSEKEAAAKPS